MTQLIIGIIAIIIALFIIKKVVGCVARIVIIIILCAILSILYATHANAQLFKPKKKAQESYTVTQDGQIKKRALFEKKPKAESGISAFRSMTVRNCWRRSFKNIRRRSLFSCRSIIRTGRQ